MKTSHRIALSSCVAISLSVCLLPLRFHLLAAPGDSPSDKLSVDWAVYGGDKQGDRYSPLTQISRDNVKQLQVAWTWDTGETSGLQTHPLVVDGRMFVYTPSQKVAALDAATGKEIWRFDSGISSGQPDRGFAYWRKGAEKISLPRRCTRCGR